MVSSSDSEPEPEPELEAGLGAGELDTERTAIREELSTLSFEELQKLKERMGAKVYKEAFFGTSKSKDAAPRVFKRENKNRPREMSSKKPVTMVREIDAIKKKREFRDPRFDPLCGDFDKKTFKENYTFLKEVRSNDARSLREELKETADPDRKATIKLLLQRLENQAREEKRHKEKQEAKQKEKQKLVQELRQGKKPEYLKKSEKRVKDLVEQYEELQKSGRLQKHIEKKRKKNTQKARKQQRAPPT